MQDSTIDLIASAALGRSPEPDPDGAKFHERDAEGNFVETRPKHHVDPLGKTEAVTPSESRKRPKTLLERLGELVQSRTLIDLRTKSGDQFMGFRLVEVTDELVVLHPDPVKSNEGSLSSDAVVLVDSIESWRPMP